MKHKHSFHVTIEPSIPTIICTDPELIDAAAPMDESHDTLLVNVVHLDHETLPQISGASTLKHRLVPAKELELNSCIIAVLEEIEWN